MILTLYNWLEKKNQEQRVEIVYFFWQYFGVFLLQYLMILKLT